MSGVWENTRVGAGRERRNNGIILAGSFSKGLSLGIFQREEIKCFAFLEIMGRRERNAGFLGMGEFPLEQGRVFDGKKGKNGIQLMVGPKMFDPRFFLDQE